jgi:hypothetical protein
LAGLVSGHTIKSVYLFIKGGETVRPKISSDKKPFSGIKSYSPEEILAAGGTTAFAIKMGKTPEALVKALKKAPPIEPFSDEEWAKLMNEVARDK